MASRTASRFAWLTVFAVTGLFAKQAALAQRQWEPLGPFTVDGWYVLSIAVDPSSPSTVFAGTKGLDGICGIFKSSDGGLTWAVVNIISSPTTEFGVVALAIDPLLPST